MKDRGNHECLSEHWLLDNLPAGWEYDCVTIADKPGHKQGFVIRSTNPGELFIPLDLLKRNRTNREFRKVTIEEARDKVRREYRTNR